MLIMPKFVEKNRLNMPSTRIRQEQEIVAQMVRIYCRQKEKHTDLCPDCKELLQYAHARLSHCPFGEKKTTCRLCPVHCYKPDRRKKMQEVMRFAGPRMILYHIPDGLGGLDNISYAQVIIPKQIVQSILHPFSYTFTLY